ncbi:hypothetical protein [Duncaniella muris]|uniref:hypothetical protein n=1 Tax=Duncaniella muris TaxID=2094150 RepID=UPI003F674A42
MTKQGLQGFHRRVGPTPLIVRQLRERIRRQEEQTSSDYAMTFDVGINPSVAV